MVKRTVSGAGKQAHSLGRGASGTSAALVLTCLVITGGACQRSTIPAALSDQEFWELIETLSEPPGTFDLSEAFVSNEPHFPDLVRLLRPTGNVYIGVGPEQNFSYIARLRPAMAFIIDIRRENLSLHLLYKALFELAADRVDFVSRLFSRPRPPTLGADASVEDIFAGVEDMPSSPEQYEATRRLVRERLLVTHRLPLSRADLAWIERAFTAFYTQGPEIRFWGPRTGDEAGPTYRQLMTAQDVTRHGRSFLATEDGFTWVKQMHASNRIVPVVGDFGGPSALRRVGEYVRQHGEAVDAFYSSNVGAYLNRTQARAFCRNLATLPAAPGAMFIESNRMRPLAAKLRACRASRGVASGAFANVRWQRSVGERRSRSEQGRHGGRAEVPGPSARSALVDRIGNGRVCAAVE